MQNTTTKKFVKQLWRVFIEHTSTVRKLVSILMDATNSGVSYTEVYTSVKTDMEDNYLHEPGADPSVPAARTPQGRSFLTTLATARKMAYDKATTARERKLLAPIRVQNGRTPSGTPATRQKLALTAARQVMASLEAGVKLPGLTKTEAVTLARLLAKIKKQ